GELSSRPLFVLSYNYFTLYLLVLRRELFREAGLRRSIAAQIAQLVGKLGFVRFGWLEHRIAEFNEATNNGN
ncbi:MAG: hypothetical protein JST42_18220, partial [Bacteroidetes bacterium]|nr:hypothetical protein [Bacteroidota bacterium]